MSASVKRTCSLCGKEHKAGSKAWDAERTACANHQRCIDRAFKKANLLTKPHVGFNPEAAYRDAPKLGGATTDPAAGGGA